MDDLQEQLPGPWVEDEDSAVDRFCRQVAFECLVNRYSVDIGVINEELHLVAEQLRVVLAVQEFLIAL